MAPLQVASVPGVATPGLFAGVLEAGLTEGAGPGEGIHAEVGSGPANFDPQANPQEWQWSPAGFSSQDGAAEVWTGVLSSDSPGTQAFTFRFSLDGVHWVYADSTGSGDGFEAGFLGTWTVPSPPQVSQVTPDHGTVLGGDTVIVSGSGFAPGAAVLLDGIAVVGLEVSETKLTFQVPAHGAESVGLVVENPDGQTATVANAFRYVLEFTCTPDGDLSEWDEAFRVGINGVESNWDPDLNHLDKLYLAFDSQFLYVAVGGSCEPLNYIIGYLDVDYGQASGVADMLALSDNGGDGDLDDALSNTLKVSVDGFGAEFGFGTRGMSSFQMGTTLSGAVFVGWRELELPYDLAWVQGSVMGSGAGLEAAVPLETLFPGGVPLEGVEVTAFVKLVDRYGDLVGISNQTLPGFFDEDDPTLVGGVSSMFVK